MRFCLLSVDTVAVSEGTLDRRINVVCIHDSTVTVTNRNLCHYHRTLCSWLFGAMSRMVVLGSAMVFHYTHPNCREPGAVFPCIQIDNRRGIYTVMFVIGGCGRGVGTLDRRIHDGCINASTEKASSYILCHHCHKLHSPLFETTCRMVAPGTSTSGMTSLGKRRVAVNIVLFVPVVRSDEYRPGEYAIGV